MPKFKHKTAPIMNPIEQFELDTEKRIETQSTKDTLTKAAKSFTDLSIESMYSYNFKWLGRPIIQYPQDMAMMQELIWEVKPDLIIEAGIAHGGSLILSASMLSLLDYCDAVNSGENLNPKLSKRKVLGLDIDIRSHNKSAIENHPMGHLIEMFEGSSISEEMIEKVKTFASNYKRIMVFLDSNHTHQHVLEELRAYAPLTSMESYCVVFDTVVEDLPESLYNDRPWSVGDNPKTAVFQYLKEIQDQKIIASDNQPLNLEIDKSIDSKLLISVAPDGYLKRVR